MTPRPPAPRVAPQLMPPAAAPDTAMFWCFGSYFDPHCCFGGWRGRINTGALQWTPMKTVWPEGLTWFSRIAANCCECLLASSKVAHTVARCLHAKKRGWEAMRLEEWRGVRLMVRGWGACRLCISHSSLNHYWLCTRNKYFGNHSNLKWRKEKSSTTYLPISVFHIKIYKHTYIYSSIL